MRVIIAYIFKVLFRIPFLRSRYYGIVFRIIQPLKLFNGITRIVTYDRDLKMKLDLDEWVQQHIFFLGYFDLFGITLVKSRLTEGNVFIDVGANIGSYTLVAAKLVGKTGKVFAFEPVGSAFNRLSENISLNDPGNIKAEQTAIFNSNQKLDFHLSSNKNLGMSSIYHHDAESGAIEQVGAIRLDDYVKDHSIERIDMIKIDIEGSEMFALQGMTDTLRNFKPDIFIELKDEAHLHSEYSVNDIIGFLNRLGYKQNALDEAGNLIPDLNKKRKDYYNFLFKF